jgi:hypothetical protein
MNEQGNSDIAGKAGEPTPSGSPDGSSSRETRTSPTLNEVRQRAYEKWEAAGKPEGNDIRFWLEAEKELLEAR